MAKTFSVDSKRRGEGEITFALLIAESTLTTDLALDPPRARTPFSRSVQSDAYVDVNVRVSNPPSA
jgi:hypothetical protein